MRISVFSLWQAAGATCMWKISKVSPLLNLIQKNDSTTSFYQKFYQEGGRGGVRAGGKKKT